MSDNTEKFNSTWLWDADNIGETEQACDLPTVQIMSKTADAMVFADGSAIVHSDDAMPLEGLIKVAATAVAYKLFTAAMDALHGGGSEQ